MSRVIFHSNLSPVYQSGIELKHHSDNNARFVALAEMIGAASLRTSRDKLMNLQLPNSCEKPYNLEL